MSQSPCVICGSASCRFSFPKMGTVPPGDCPHFRGLDRVPSPVFGLRKLGSRFFVSQAEENLTSRVALQSVAEVPPQTTPTVPFRIAIAIASPFSPQVALGLASRIILRTTFHFSRQDTSLVTVRINPQIPARKASEQTLRTTPGTVPGTVPKATRGASSWAACN